MYRRPGKFFKKKTGTPPPPIKPIFTLSDEYKASICSQSYIGKKGYTIPKSIIDKADAEQFLKDLNVKPMLFGPNQPDTTPFPVFRENTNKYYLPRFYGIQRYGMPAKIELQPGADISVDFEKPLRDYQDNIVGIYVDYVKKAEHGCSGGILEVPCGRGKCLGKDTQILMYDGTLKKVQDICIGDKIMGDDSNARNVLSLARGREMMYKVSSKKGDDYIVNESHILSLKTSIKMNKDTPKNSVIDISVLEYLDLSPYYHGRSGPYLGYRVPIIFQDKPIEIDPYLIGYWLGDGSSKGTLITTQESTVIKYMVDCFKTKHKSLYLKYTGAQYDYRINTISKNKKNILMDFLRKYNMVKNKHIPIHYKCNSKKKQFALLAGLIDSDGYFHDNCYEITQKNEKLLDDIVFLARSLGFSANKTRIEKTCTNAKDVNGNLIKKTGVYYKTGICGVGLENIPTLCLRKKAQPRKLIRDCLKYRIALEKLKEDDYYGFEIDGNRRFVLGDFTVTHNTVMGLKIISLLKKKSLILVHKEFLMNQWIERISEFLPSARVGKIQASTFDIADKDIVIGMIQTLYDKEYPQGTFDSFGLTIVDEVHRIGSEQFSRTLFKTITPFMLGISATVDRKDKLTRVLYMFIGEKIYTEKRDNDDLVCVRAIEYKSNDPAFNEVEVDFRGNTKYSTMIVKLCEFGPRSDFIIRVIGDLLEESENQIMVLCHNRSLLTYLYESICHKKLATVGFYVGGMKQANLQETEEKQIVLATYAMAAEALDIKTLASLVMITPKTDITQSVGRILRVKHDSPIIVDIIDAHDVFQNQWTQRKRFYKKCNYWIQQTDSRIYTSDWSNAAIWKTVFEPKNSTNNSHNKEIGEDSDGETGPDGVTSKFTPKPIGKCLIDTSIFANLEEI
jgi:hypothetical protein